MDFAGIFAGILTSVLILIIRKRKEKKYASLLFAYKQELKSIASQILSGKNCQLSDGLIQYGDLLYLITENNQQLIVHPLNKGKTMNISKFKYRLVKWKLRHKRTICWDKGIIYHRIDEPFENCILLIKKFPLIKKLTGKKSHKNDGQNGCCKNEV
jgi:hypothetical protein